VVVERTIPPGNWRFSATVSGFGLAPGPDEDDLVGSSSHCLLDDAAGGLLASAKTSASDFGTETLTMNGGAVVPAGQTKTVRVLCAMTYSGELDSVPDARFDSAQLLTVGIGGFF
jgi:hypothetical protein